VLCAVAQGRAAAQSPADIVHSFCALDFDGARLKSVSTDPIWQLTTREGEPPVQPVQLVSDWSVLSTSVKDDSALVVVSYTTIGSIKEEGSGSVLRRASGIQQYSFNVENTKDGWKIRIDQLNLSPHVGLTAYKNHVNELLRVSIKHHTGSGLRFNSLKKLENDLDALQASRQN
jgi:hypothetical protein